MATQIKENTTDRKMEVEVHLKDSTSVKLILIEITLVDDPEDQTTIFLALQRPAPTSQKKGSHDRTCVAETAQRRMMLNL